MQHTGDLRAYLATALVLALGTTAPGECPSIDFEDLSVGTAVTTQYPGVTFSVEPQSCGGEPTLYMRIADAPPGGTSSGAKVLQIDVGCPEPSTDYVRITFDELQDEVSFTLGVGTGAAGSSVDVRYLGDGFGEIDTLFAESGGGVHRLVRVVPGDGWSGIRGIEIESPISEVEVIDDLTFEVDSTPPLVDIDAPAYEACACGVVTITGIVCDDDGEYAQDKAEYRPVNAAPDEPWQPIGSCTGAFCEVCEADFLYSWNTDALPHGFYFVRLIATNACGLEASDVTVVYVDKQFDIVSLRSPQDGDIVGGDNVCIDGTVWDYRCFDAYGVEYRPAAGGPWSDVDEPLYTERVMTDPLAHWDTIGTGVADGEYVLRVGAIDDCENTAMVTHNITIDNTAPTAEITEPVNCEYVEGVVQVRGTVDDAHLASWSLQYTGGTMTGWSPSIASGDAPIIDGLLGEWDTTELPPCAYTLRLRVTDQAIVNCDDPHRTDYFVSVNVGSCGDFDTDDDGDVDLGDFAAFQEAFTGPLP